MQIVKCSLTFCWRKINWEVSGTKSLMYLILFYTTFCFATRFQTIWEKMEPPAEFGRYVLGSSLCANGDVNGDGFADFLISRYSNNALDSTASNYVYLFLGNSIIDIEPYLIFEHPVRPWWDAFGLYINFLGDVNSDGYDDFAIIAWNAITDTMPWGELAPGGKIYIYFGSPSPDTIPEMVINGHLSYQAPE